MPRSRRTLLKTLGVALGSGTLASTAGCLGGQPTSTETSPDEAATTTSTPAATQSGEARKEFRQWLPDPTTTPLPDGYGVRYFDVAAIRSYRDAIHPNAYDRLEGQMLQPVSGEFVDAADIVATVQIDHVMELALGSFDPEAVGERITSDDSSATSATTRTPTTATATPWPEPERYKGFDLYGTDYGYAASSDAFLSVSPMLEGDGIDYAKAIIDATTSETSQYADGNEYVASMFSTVDAPHALWCFPEATDGSTRRGFRADDITGQLKAWRFGQETTHLTFANTYVDAATAESGELAAFVDAESERFGAYDGLDVETEDRLAWTDGTIPTGEFDHLSAGGPEEGVTTPN
ncbi:hypothetical protein D3D02_01505 [Halobellus sp. Atlit-38R]|uniref:hypothetical protein n=1 Tax=Halobellus sp. Atlit-38R TaxID=2282131 RepID=UPI000EF248BF|nr:hypothetical protein [Halobellus sp. Atlit-38R]RLM94692.1 hypothetical protein D3D02_01505 [Halobellus sp. Atlit-38R]